MEEQRRGPPAAAGVAAEQQLLAFAADSAVGLVAVFVVHVEELQESILAKGQPGGEKDRGSGSEGKDRMQLCSIPGARQELRDAHPQCFVWREHAEGQAPWSPGPGTVTPPVPTALTEAGLDSAPQTPAPAQPRHGGTYPARLAEAPLKQRVEGGRVSSPAGQTAVCVTERAPLTPGQGAPHRSADPTPPPHRGLQRLEPLL